MFFPLAMAIRCFQSPGIGCGQLATPGILRRQQPSPRRALARSHCQPTGGGASGSAAAGPKTFSGQGILVAAAWRQPRGPMMSHWVSHNIPLAPGSP